MVKNECLDTGQVAYLLNYKSKRHVQKLISDGKLKAFGSNKKRLVKSDDLYDYMNKKLSRYFMYFDFKDAEDKKIYWDNSHYGGVRFLDESKYVSGSQAAFLLGVERQTILLLIKKGKINADIFMINDFERKAIRIEDIIEYADNKLKSYNRLIEYFRSEDTVEFWKGLEDGKQI